MQLFSGKAEHMPKIGEEWKFILGLWKWCQYKSNNYNCNFEFSSTQSLVPLYVDQCWMCSSAQSWRRRIFRFSHSSGWWFQTCGLFSYILGISSYQLTFAPWFFRGVGLNHQPALVLGNPRKSSISHRFPIDFPKINHRFPRKSSISHRFSTLSVAASPVCHTLHGPRGPRCRHWWTAPWGASDGPEMCSNKHRLE